METLNTPKPTTHLPRFANTCGLIALSSLTMAFVLIVAIDTALYLTSLSR